MKTKFAWSSIGIPLVAFAIFFAIWSVAASKIETSLGKVPGPLQVLGQARNLGIEYIQEKQKQKAFHQRQVELSAKLKAENPTAETKIRKYPGKPTYLDQILTSLVTVFAGFLIASAVGVPIGILCGLSRTAMTALKIGRAHV